MELLFYGLIFCLVVFLNVGLYLPSLLTVNEEDIGKNTKCLKKYDWFQQILHNQEFKQLIIYDNDVRKAIGKFNNQRIDTMFFQNRYRKKLEGILTQKSSTYA